MSRLLASSRAASKAPFMLSNSATEGAKAVGAMMAKKKGESAAVHQVKQKLKAMEEYKDWDEDRLTGEALALTTKEDIKNLFSHLHDDMDVFEQAEEDREAFPEGQFLHSLEYREAHERAKDRFKTVTHFPVRLLLSPIEGERMLKTEAGVHLARLSQLYGPLHAALVIGDVKVEWNDSSLVIPQQVNVQAGPVAPFQTAVQHTGQWGDQVTKMGATMATAAKREMDFDKQVDLMVDMSTDKAKLIDQLADVIVRYNRVYYYHPIARNCQGFVLDAMKALQITNPPHFQGRLKEYYDYLCKNKKIVSTFSTHADLDAYVTANLNSLTDKEDMEYLCCLYFQFHMKAGMESPANWVCPERGCRMGELVQRLSQQAESKIIHQFLPHAQATGATSGANP